MAATQPDKTLIRGPLRAPVHRPAAVSYTQAPRMKSETDVGLPGDKQVDYKEVSLTRLPQPFVNPRDAFAPLSKRES
ncbi:uncharacterized protein THITE_2170205 [Thermothielavioides terrestris NRRL 8126]|uniref:Uncharacterized protein n=1 Tax=Thermothielavioides terrestris (strain ATCC 38088 / NRRL 8126) TaxID=578455 RepID=G2R4N5_THETT|nr:uncharacterized protein THITE_2170205 [Thermothielavioides terrestris NRRL 8126]AEO66075.1 hypothetical protein THITE_2170205 [Thermothielavioides terrestris NRRL 8126]